MHQVKILMLANDIQYIIKHQHVTDHGKICTQPALNLNATASVQRSKLHFYFMLTPGNMKFKHLNNRGLDVSQYQYSIKQSNTTCMTLHVCFTSQYKHFSTTLPSVSLSLSSITCGISLASSQCLPQFFTPYLLSGL